MFPCAWSHMLDSYHIRKDGMMCVAVYGLRSETAAFLCSLFSAFHSKDTSLHILQWQGEGWPPVSGMESIFFFHTAKILYNRTCSIFGELGHLYLIMRAYSFSCSFIIAVPVSLRNNGLLQVLCEPLHWFNTDPTYSVWKYLSLFVGCFGQFSSLLIPEWGQ